MGKNNIKLSVVVPCYNVEKYVEKAINCLMKQTYNNLEIIAIDDCSTDSTYGILQELEKNFEYKFKLYKNEKNQGLAYTRNYGVEVSSGDFVGFIDPDDYVEENYYKNFIEKIQEASADLAICDIQLVDEKENKIAPLSKACVGDITKKNIIDNGMCASACNKVIKKDMLLKYPFLVGKINEDVASIIPIIVKSKKIVYVQNNIYYYVQRVNSIQKKSFSEKRFDMFDSVNVCLNSIKNEEDYEVIKEIILLNQIVSLYIYIIIEIDDSKLRKKYIKEFNKKLIEYDFKIYDMDLLNTFIKRHRKLFRLYYKVLIKLLKYNMINSINTIIWFRKEFKTFINKLIGRNIENKKYDLISLEKLAKKQSKMKENDIKLSVVVPNYNYEKYLIKRLYSILSQNVKLHEIIILDDNSKDNSRKLIDKIISKISKYVNIKKIYNEKNSGNAFYQWQKGMNLANGEYVWIAEADDYCKNNLLYELLKPIKKDKNIILSYCDTSFVDGKGNRILKSVKSLIDLRNTGHWNKSYINNGIDEIKNYSFLNCTIANVSSCIIKNGNYNDIFTKSISFRQAGDWVFYINVMKEGSVSYTDKILNFYRMHGNNISSTIKKEEHLKEIIRIHEMVKNEFNIDDKFHNEQMNKRYDELKKAWNI